MRFDREVFYLKSDTKSGIEGLVLKNRQEHHYGASDIGLLHDLFEHPYKPIANPYLDEIAALGAFNEYRCYQQGGDIQNDLREVIYYKFKWDYKYISELNDVVVDLVDSYKDTEHYDYINKYKYVINYYFNLGASIFHNRFNNYFNSYSDLYYGLGDEVITKLTPLVNSDLENIKLTINYKEREVKVEY